MEIKIFALGPHLPTSTRRVVSWIGKLQRHETAVGLVEALADGGILVRPYERDKAGKLVVVDEGIEIDAKAARVIADAFLHSSFAVEDAARHARGYHTTRARRDDDGNVFVRKHDVEHPMRLSRLRRPRRCRECVQPVMELWIVALARRSDMSHDEELCSPCLEAIIAETAKVSTVYRIA